jgi:hypothetical protein
MTCSGRGVEGTSGMDGGMGLDGSAELLLGRALKYLKTQPLLGKSMSLEVTCQIYSNE